MAIFVEKVAIFVGIFFFKMEFQMGFPSVQGSWTIFYHKVTFPVTILVL